MSMTMLGLLAPDGPWAPSATAPNNIADVTTPTRHLPSSLGLIFRLSELRLMLAATPFTDADPIVRLKQL
jgi:hypothetical protein